jgi:hypothetical protein
MPVTHAAKQANSTKSLTRKGMRLSAPFASLCSAILTVQEVALRRISGLNQEIIPRALT